MAPLLPFARPLLLDIRRLAIVWYKNTREIVRLKALIVLSAAMQAYLLWLLGYRVLSDYGVSAA